MQVFRDGPKHIFLIHNLFCLVLTAVIWIFTWLTNTKRHRKYVKMCAYNKPWHKYKCNMWLMNHPQHGMENSSVSLKSLTLVFGFHWPSSNTLLKPYAVQILMQFLFSCGGDAIRMIIQRLLMTCNVIDILGFSMLTFFATSSIPLRVILFHDGKTSWAFCTLLSWPGVIC